VLEIVLTLECAVEHSNMEEEEEEDLSRVPHLQRSSLPTSQSHSQLQNYDTVLWQQQHQQKLQQQQQQQQQQQHQQQQQEQLSVTLALSNSVSQPNRKNSDVPPLPSELVLHFSSFLQ